MQTALESSAQHEERDDALDNVLVVDFHPEHHERHLCACGRPRAFYRRGAHRYGRRNDHPLCRQCWRSVVDRNRPVPTSDARIVWRPPRAA